MHILIIEDDLDFGLALHKALKAEGLSSERINLARYLLVFCKFSRLSPSLL